MALGQYATGQNPSHKQPAPRMAPHGNTLRESRIIHTPAKEGNRMNRIIYKHALKNVTATCKNTPEWQDAMTTLMGCHLELLGRSRANAKIAATMWWLKQEPRETIAAFAE